MNYEQKAEVPASINLKCSNFWVHFYKWPSDLHMFLAVGCLNCFFLPTCLNHHVRCIDMRKREKILIFSHMQFWSPFILLKWRRIVNQDIFALVVYTTGCGVESPQIWKIARKRTAHVTLKVFKTMHFVKAVYNKIM